MSNENDPEREKENPFLKGLNDFVSGIKGGFENFQKSLQDQSKKSVENWGEKGQDNVNNFFNKIGENWNNQIKKWTGDMQKMQIESQEQWEAQTGKVQQEIEKWQDQTRKDLKDGVKSWNRSVVKGAYMFLIVMVPVIIVLVLVIWVITQFLNLVPGT
jgi:nitrate/nitrite-specific signal transduction histidine kinase